MQVQERSFFQKMLHIVIDWQLYDQLLHGEVQGKKCQELTVETIDDLPPDGTIGVYDPRHNKIYADIGEIGFVSMISGRTSQQLDDQVTDVLAHEGEHYIQHTKLGYIKDLDRWALLLGFLFTSVAIAFVGWFGWLAYVKPFVFTHLQITNTFGSTFIFILLSYAVVMRPLARVSLIIFRAGKRIAYRLCWCERDARSFASKAIKDLRWQNVVKIE